VIYAQNERKSQNMHKGGEEIEMTLIIMTIKLCNFIIKKSRLGNCWRFPLITILKSPLCVLVTIVELCRKLACSEMLHTVVMERMKKTVCRLAS